MQVFGFPLGTTLTTPASMLMSTTTRELNFIPKASTNITGEALAKHYPDSDFRILVGCAPCQTFSRYTRGLSDDDPKWTLLGEFARLIREVKPHIVSMENVPELQFHPIYAKFLGTLSDEGFHFTGEEKEAGGLLSPTMAYRNNAAVWFW